MKIETCEKESFVVIGKKGRQRTEPALFRSYGMRRIPILEKSRIWQKKDEDGNISGIWGAMSDFSRSFQPWEGFQKGLYLAGVECNEDAKAPDGWAKWVIPGYEYIYVERENDNTFSEVIQYMKGNGIAPGGRSP